jgi:hypothetical protein
MRCTVPTATPNRAAIWCSRRPQCWGKARHTRMALAIMADASEVVAGRISEKDVSAKIDGSLEAPASTSKIGQIHRMIYRHKNIRIFWYCLGCR